MAKAKTRRTRCHIGAFFHAERIACLAFYSWLPNVKVRQSQIVPCTRMIENLLKLRRRGAAIALLKVGESANVGRVETVEGTRIG